MLTPTIRLPACTLKNRVPACMDQKPESPKHVLGIGVPVCTCRELRIRVSHVWCGLTHSPVIRVPVHMRQETESPGMLPENQNHWPSVWSSAHSQNKFVHVDNQSSHEHAMRNRVPGCMCQESVISAQCGLAWHQESVHVC